MLITQDYASRLSWALIFIPFGERIEKSATPKVTSGDWSGFGPNGMSSVLLPRQDEAGVDEQPLVVRIERECLPKL
jgi:hypothetical protein